MYPLQGDVYWATFSETEPEAVFAVRITRLVNWPELGCDLNHAMIWVRDGGTPGVKGDEVGFYIGDCVGVGYEDEPTFDPTAYYVSFPVEVGNLMIRQKLLRRGGAGGTGSPRPIYAPDGDKSSGISGCVCQVEQIFLVG